MMEVSKVLLYCTKKKPYLFENYTDKVTWDKVFARKFGEWNRFMLIGAKPDYIGSGNYYLNGFVCFECDCKESWLLRRHSGFGDNYFSNCSCENIRLQERSCLTDKQLCSYLGAYGYAYHFESVKPIDPMPITCLYKDEACTKPLTKAPQSYCFAYRKRLVEESEVNDFIEEGGKAFDSLGRVVRWSTIDGYWVSEKVLVFSIRSPWLCKIANGEKDLEIRKSCPKEIKVISNGD
jgi:hypothetical protein